MSRFICALHAPSGTPSALALVEQTEPGYAVRVLRSLSGDDPMRDLTDLLASEPQYVAQTTVVTTGGQRVADAIHEVGPSAVAVALGQGDADAHATTTRTLVDTFERLYRAGTVQVDASLDLASPAVDALYSAADLEAAAPDSDRTASGDLVDSLDGRVQPLNGTSYQGDGPAPSVVEQSGTAAPTSTEVIDAPVSPAEATAAAVDARTSTSRVATGGAGAVDLGEHADIATALALACWFGETSRDALPVTDKADEANANRVNRPDRRN